MSSLLERLSRMAGVQLTEAQLHPKIQLIYIKLFDVGMEDQPDQVINQFVAKAVETQDVLTVDDWRINHDTLMLEFVPMLRHGEVPMHIAKEFRDYMIDFLSDPENMETYESVQEHQLTPAELTTIAEGKELHTQVKVPGHYPVKNGKVVGDRIAGHRARKHAAANDVDVYSIDPQGKTAEKVTESEEELEEARRQPGSNTMAAAGRKAIAAGKEAAKEREEAEKAAAEKKDVKEATGSNKVYDEIGAWKVAASKAGLEVYSQGAADGKYTAKKDGEVYGRFNKESGEGWLHSSAIKEAAQIGQPEFADYVLNNYYVWGGNDEDNFTVEERKQKFNIRYYGGSVTVTPDEPSRANRTRAREIKQEILSQTMHEAATITEGMSAEQKAKFQAQVDKGGKDLKTAIKTSPMGSEKGMVKGFRGAVKAAYKAKSAVKEDAEEYNQPVDATQQAPLPQGLAEIAQTLGFQTLDPQATPGQSQQVSADIVRTALLAAYNLGKTQGDAETTPAAQAPVAGTAGATSGQFPAPTSRTSADHQQVSPVGR